MRIGRTAETVFNAIEVLMTERMRACRGSQRRAPEIELRNAAEGRQHSVAVIEHESRGPFLTISPARPRAPSAYEDDAAGQPNPAR